MKATRSLSVHKTSSLRLKGQADGDRRLLLEHRTGAGGDPGHVAGGAGLGHPPPSHHSQVDATSKPVLSISEKWYHQTTKFCVCTIHPHYLQVAIVTYVMRYIQNLHACTRLTMAEGQLSVMVPSGYSHVPVLL